jgi:hypothetical protein
MTVSVKPASLVFLGNLKQPPETGAPNINENMDDAKMRHAADVADLKVTVTTTVYPRWKTQWNLAINFMITITLWTLGVLAALAVLTFLVLTANETQV